MPHRLGLYRRGWGRARPGDHARRAPAGETRDAGHAGNVEDTRRAAFIEKGGWDKMPGEDTGSSTVARACASGLEVLLKK